MDEISKAVDVICVCDARGEIRPLRMRMEQADQSMLRVNIDEIVTTRQISYVGAEANIYLCRATVHNRELLFELKYLIRSHSWKLLQRIY